MTIILIPEASGHEVGFWSRVPESRVLKGARSGRQRARLGVVVEYYFRRTIGVIGVEMIYS